MSLEGVGQEQHGEGGCRIDAVEQSKHTQNHDGETGQHKGDGVQIANCREVGVSETELQSSSGTTYVERSCRFCQRFRPGQMRD